MAIVAITLQHPASLHPLARQPVPARQCLLLGSRLLYITVWDHEVGGSNPPTPTTVYHLTFIGFRMLV